ncbi:hypothetical protein G6O67_007426 [Ophiocordyceps sinensis]|uniref:Uncharacterized protein n=1 Tax=Ophiocordyceps sinensis TaxID=72228 RepID=A0A8H4LUU1_9HYPO|nr:hypothetical protein G6O67_007426 [Ophiocordyceps sinensis]
MADASVPPSQSALRTSTRRKLRCRRASRLDWLSSSCITSAGSRRWHDALGSGSEAHHGGESPACCAAPAGFGGILALERKRGGADERRRERTARSLMEKHKEQNCRRDYEQTPFSFSPTHPQPPKGKERGIQS